MDLGLSDKRVVVTGASRGIGAAIAKAFLAEGSQVCLVSRGSKHLFETQRTLATEYGENRVIADTCDCTDEQALLSLVGRIHQRWSGVDIVVANII